MITQTYDGALMEWANAALDLLDAATDQEHAADIGEMRAALGTRKAASIQRASAAICVRLGYASQAISCVASTVLFGRSTLHPRGTQKSERFYMDQTYQQLEQMGVGPSFIAALRQKEPT